MAYLVAFWNLENLFAPEGFPGREPWIANAVQNDLRGWTQALFDQKVAQLASIIVQMKAGAGPDLLGVCEVENRFALEAVANQLNALRPARNYQLVHVDSTRDQRGIDTAFIFDANVLATNLQELFSHWVMRRTGTRDIPSDVHHGGRQRAHRASQSLAVTFRARRARAAIFRRFSRDRGRDARLLAWAHPRGEGQRRGHHRDGRFQRRPVR